MSSRLKLTGIALAAAFALAACGGGGNGVSDNGVPATDPRDQQIAELTEENERLRNEKENAEAEEAAKATSATAKALRAAIMKGVDGGTTAVTTASIPVLGTGDDATTVISLKKGDSAGSLGGWNGTDYAGEDGTGDAKTTGMVRTYSNPGATKSVAFGTEAGEAIHGLARTSGTPAGDYTVTSGANPNIGGFPEGTQTYESGDTVTGSFMGAPGTYTCTGGSDCTSVHSGDGTSLATGTWTFTPSPGAMLQMKDATYLHFGWWLRKDKDGPTHAGAIYGSTTGLTAVTGINNAALVAKATYMGKAAGKFAISDPLRPANDNAGHFTANAELTADLKAADSTLSGTIDTFRLNDGSDDPGWSVELQKAGFVTDKFRTADTPDGDQTVWSVGGNKGAASGRWEAQMFDENANDGSNVPTSVVGSFQSSIGTTHELVGAFGATRK